MSVDLLNDLLVFCGGWPLTETPTPTPDRLAFPQRTTTLCFLERKQRDWGGNMETEVKGESQWYFDSRCWLKNSCPKVDVARLNRIDVWRLYSYFFLGQTGFIGIDSWKFEDLHFKFSVFSMMNGIFLHLGAAESLEIFASEQLFQSPGGDLDLQTYLFFQDVLVLFCAKTCFQNDPTVEEFGAWWNDLIVSNYCNAP